MRFAIAFLTVMLSIGGGCTSTSAQPTSDCYARDDNSCICTANADGGSPTATSAPTCAAGDTPMNACDPEALSAQCRPSESAFTTCSNQ